MKYFFGIDGGGTRSRLKIITGNDELVYQGEGGSTNIYAVLPEEALDNVYTLLAGGLEAAGIGTADISAGCVGSAGLSRPPEKKLFEDFFKNRFGLTCPLYLCNDGEILLVGGLEKLEGLCLIAGTGSLALGRLADGSTARSGGYGYMIGDEGSAFWIAHQAIRRSMRSMEGRDLPTGMLDALQKEYGLSSPDEFVYLLHKQFNKADIASRAGMVSGFALKKDPLAADILREASENLVSLVVSVVSRMPELEKADLVLSGGVLENDRYIRDQFAGLLGSKLPDVRIAEKRRNAVDGACMIARSL
ncbi:ATPase [Treponema sp. OttesenSCG-928-L16]|nr:ATPase [Treponema sp. OttesenSCG-928-L16]